MISTARHDVVGRREHRRRRGNPGPSTARLMTKEISASTLGWISSRVLISPPSGRAM